MAERRAVPVALVLSLAAAVVLCGVATLLSVRAERARLDDERAADRRRVAEELAVTLVRRVDERLTVALRDAAKTIEDGDAGVISRAEAGVISRGEAGLPIAVYDPTGSRRWPPLRPPVTLEEVLLDRDLAERAALEAALRALEDGTPEAVERALGDLVERTVDPVAGAIARYLALRAADGAGSVSRAADLARALGEDGLDRLPPALAVATADRLLSSIGAGNEVRARSLLDRAALALEPAIQRQPAVAEAWHRTLVARASPAVAVEANVAWRRRVRFLTAVDATLPLEVVAVAEPDRIEVFDGGRLRRLTIVGPTGEALTLVAGPPEDGGRDVLAEIGPPGWTLVDPVYGEGPAGAALAVALAAPLRPWVLVAPRADDDGAFPWRSALAGTFLVGCLLVAAGTARLAVRSLRREEEIVRARSEFLAAVSHQLKTPVANLLLFAETLGDGRVERDEDRQRMLQILRDEAERLGDYVERVLTVSRLDSSVDDDLPREPIDVGRLLEAARERWMLAATRAGGRLAIEVDGAGARVLGDERALAWALDNVVENALRHGAGPDGPEVVVVASSRGRDLVVDVRDRGPGIPPALRDRVFERFFRAPGAKTRAGEGTGLGLAIAREGVRRSGGTIEVADTGATGTTIRMRLPRDDLT